jgi:dTDP-4-dehydrorhamnose 3,5-epimerase
MAERFHLIPQRLPEVLLVEHPVFGDARGRFGELFREEDFRAAGFPAFVQENGSRSGKDVLRGLHFQDAPRAQGKLVRCARGRVFDVAVDVRQGSPTLGQWVGVELDEERPAMLWIPVGFAHGFCVLSELADVVYKITDYYSPEHERAVSWRDPTLGVAWPVAAPLLSDKDARAPLLAAVAHHLVHPGRTP